MIKTVTLNGNQQPTKEQTNKIEAAAKKDIVFDEDSPALTPSNGEPFCRPKIEIHKRKQVSHNF